ncbi:MAG: hypothetical protein QMD46_13095 [Methanomicrobiales archaeon]|nr:hypothetical protein [Methanomicrobiales archaeon]MDI6877593.1 hypothetical protein [Methanomicrobiales archaeon]
MEKRGIAALALLVWMFASVTIIALTGYPYLDVYFILMLLGLALILEFTESFFSRPRYHSYLWFLFAANSVIFVILMAERIMRILRL